MNKIAGYIYYTTDKENPNVELRRDRLLSGITVTAVFSKTGERDVTVTATTGQDGFYEIDIGTDYVGYSVKITVNVPTNRYETLTKTTDGSSNYTKVSSNALNSSSGTSASMYSSTSGKYFIGIYNGGLLPLE